MRIGILLGSFDPIHIGHLHMIVSTLNQEIVDRVIIVPSVQNVWKDASPEEFSKRCTMIKLAVEEIDGCSLSDIDYSTSEPHYSYKTLELIKRQYSSDELYLIVGSDVLCGIEKWEQSSWIIENFKLILVPRHNYNIPELTLDYIPVTSPSYIIVSSSTIRNYIKIGKQIYPLVPRVVSQYIKKYNLYK